jgi:hypothetical protein
VLLVMDTVVVEVKSSSLEQFVALVVVVVLV